MKPFFLPLTCVLLISTASLSAQAPAPASAPSSSARKASTIILDENGVKNLRIETVMVEPGDFEETVFALGRIEARPGRVAAVTSRISGRVTAISALPGDAIAAGAEVLKVESRQPGNPAPVIALTSPLGGTVTRLDVRLGDPVEPDRALAEISDLGEVFAIARVPEHAAGRIQSGATAHIGVSALPGKKLTGQLLRFGTSADEASGTIDAIFVLKNDDGLIRPGMRAEFSIVLEKRADVVSVPRSALQGDAAARFVYVKDFDLKNAFVKTPVVVGQTNDRNVEILSGLLPADEVVTQGAYSLSFVGGGTISLKAALDAAHGHEHNEDGSEITKDSRKADAANEATEDGHGHSHGGGQSPFWMIVSGVLFVLLLVVSFRKKPATALAPASPTTRKGD